MCRFNVSAAACTAMAYQWYLGTNALAGQTNSILNLTSVGPANVGSYSVVVTSAGGDTNSAPASLTVIYQTPRVVGGQMLLGSGGFQLTFSGTAGAGWGFGSKGSADAVAPANAVTPIAPTTKPPASTRNVRAMSIICSALPKSFPVVRASAPVANGRL